MKCPKCHNNGLTQDFDSTRCVICGHRDWSGFKLRRPTKADVYGPDQANHNRLPSRRAS